MEKLANISLVRHQILHNPGSTQLNASRNDGFDDEKYITPQPDAYYYIAELNVGKPPQKVYLAVDTTAGLIWTQFKIPWKPIPTTQYILLADSNVIFLDLLDISVGPIRLMLPEGTFDATKGRGMILDSVSPLTVLRLDVYLLLIAGLKTYYDAQGMVQVPVEESPFTFSALLLFIKPTIPSNPDLPFPGSRLRSEIFIYDCSLLRCGCFLCSIGSRSGRQL
ncbi:hypothetical protein Patl1_22589 [Pistacia atlantica]|uniref:Uncharacterized protein n=1 Tax=Pistacia atlantica TaxID=434234 RepID=A0ACC0ZWU3_9ROSI|nr:hypothetical protein Patl1_22589 [Pistacia atlantica]